jgi:hypothetical protein
MNPPLGAVNTKPLLSWPPAFSCTIFVDESRRVFRVCWVVMFIRTCSSSPDFGSRMVIVPLVKSTSCQRRFRSSRLRMPVFSATATNGFNQFGKASKKRGFLIVLEPTQTFIVFLTKLHPAYRV